MLLYTKEPKDVSKTPEAGERQRTALSHRPQKKPNLPMSWSAISSLQNCEIINLYCLSHSVCDTSLCQPQETNRILDMIRPLDYMDFTYTEYIFGWKIEWMAINILGILWNRTQETVYSDCPGNYTRR